MGACVNRCILLGTIDKKGCELRFAQSGTPVCAFTLVLTEIWSDGKAHTTYQPVEIMGRKAEEANTLDAGQTVLVEGRLARRGQKDESWQTIVSGWDITTVNTAAAEVSA